MEIVSQVISRNLERNKSVQKCILFSKMEIKGRKMTCKKKKVMLMLVIKNHLPSDLLADDLERLKYLLISPINNIYRTERVSLRDRCIFFVPRNVLSKIL